MTIQVISPKNRKDTSPNSGKAINYKYTPPNETGEFSVIVKVTKDNGTTTQTMAYFQMGKTANTIKAGVYQKDDGKYYYKVTAKDNKGAAQIAYNICSAVSKYRLIKLNGKYLDNKTVLHVGDELDVTNIVGDELKYKTALSFVEITSESITWMYNFPVKKAKDNALKVLIGSTDTVIYQENNLDHGFITVANLNPNVRYKARLEYTYKGRVTKRSLEALTQHGDSKDIKYIVTSYQVDNGSVEAYKLDSKKITLKNGKPLVDIRYIAKAFGGRSSWSSLVVDNSVNSIITMNFESEYKRIILNTNTNTAEIIDDIKKTSENIDDLVFEKFIGAKINITNEYIRADILKIAEVLGFGNKITQSKLKDGFRAYSIDVSRVPHD